MKAVKEEWIEEQWKSIEREVMLGTLKARSNSINQQLSKTVMETS